MPRVTGYLLDEETMQYVTNGGRVFITGDAEFETSLLDNSSFAFEEVPPGSYIVSIMEVPGYKPVNKFLDIAEGDGDVDLGWFAAKFIPGSIWGVHDDFEKDEEYISGGGNA